MMESQAVLAAHDILDEIMTTYSKKAYEEYIKPKILPHAALSVRSLIE